MFPQAQQCVYMSGLIITALPQMSGRKQVAGFGKLGGSVPC